MRHGRIVTVLSGERLAHTPTTIRSEDFLIPPYGGKLIDLMCSGEEREQLLSRAATLPRLQLTPRSICDLELLATGGFSPLESFMGPQDYDSVLEEMRLSDGTLWPLPITLTFNRDTGLSLDTEVALTDGHNNILAVMNIDEIFGWDRKREAESAYGTMDSRHPMVVEMGTWGELCASGSLRVLNLPRYHDFMSLRLTPSEVRRALVTLSRPNVVAFQTRNPLHRVHEELTMRAALKVDGTLLLHPAVGMTKPGDLDHFTRVRTYKILAERYYDSTRTLLSLLPLAMRMAGPREALWHALIRRNYGANHLIVGRDHASPGLDSHGRPFYGPTEAQDLVARHEPETGIVTVPFSEMVYLPDEDRYEERERIGKNSRTASLSGSDVREEYLRSGRPLPEWYTRPEVAAVLSEATPPRYRQGFCVWFTGLSGAGKSTTAEIVAIKLLEIGRRASVLDGDIVRAHLSKGLGFSKRDRDANVRRIAFVASEIVFHGGAVLCAAVSPYRETRNECRTMVGAENFIEVFVDTPLEVCESRDAKGMYQSARLGKTKNFTGIDDPYEPPDNAELVLDTVAHTARENADLVFAHLVKQGFILPIP
jgi:sulfate adenylyltransferase